MLYKQFRGTGEKLSCLGLGTMRLPTTGPERDAPIDEERAQAIVDRAIALGVNYFDTAYMYHGGKSEGFIGRALAKYPRESYNLVSKMPGFMAGSREGVYRIFNEQLERCGVDYFDFYLCHNVNEETIEQYFDYDVIGVLTELKAQGRIRHLGFSSHGKPETLRRFVQAYDGWEFAQIQLNYLDWTLQDAKTQYEILTEAGLPVMVMEPCRGGRLADLGDEANAILKAAEPERSVASWAFRFVQSLPNVQVVLSGMNSLAQLEENAAIFSEDKALTPEETETAFAAGAELLRRFTVPCTACRYCDACPAGIDIPAVLETYNAWSLSHSPMRLAALKESDQPGPADCIGCGACFAHCPQGIHTPEIMQELAAAMEKA